MDFVIFVLETHDAKALNWALLFCGSATVLWQFTDPFGGASIRLGASIREITVFVRLYELAPTIALVGFNQKLYKKIYVDCNERHSCLNIILIIRSCHKIKKLRDVVGGFSISRRWTWLIDCYTSKGSVALFSRLQSAHKILPLVTRYQNIIDQNF